MTRYELLQRIGVGGMAEIFRGKAVAGRGFQKPVAIKRILPHLSQDSRFVELLITEAKTLSELKHRNIVQIFDVGLGDDGQYFIVMEFVDGLDLADLADLAMRNRRPLPIDVVLYLGAEVCEALEHAHNARDANGNIVGLVHRDVSPSNILLSKSGEVKLTDFGIAKRMEEMTGHGGVRGKFAYISPEQAHNEHVDGRSDVHSLGIVLFELLTNRPLFSHLPDFDALAAVREHNMPNIADVDRSLDAGLAALIMRSLAADPNKRYQDAKEFASALREYRYGMVSSTGDPAQAVARVVKESVKPKEPDLSTLPEGEGTVVRILSSVGFPGATGKEIDPDEVSTDADPYGGARQSLDSYSDEAATAIARTPRPERVAHPNGEIASAAPAEEHGGPQVDPDADTEYAMALAGVRTQEEGDFEGEIETRVLDRKDPLIMAAIQRVAAQGRKMPPLPGPRLSSEGEEQRTVPRAEPVRAPPPAPVPALPQPQPPAAAAAALAPRAPQYPIASRDDSLRFGVGAGPVRFLGMPRQVAYWVIGVGAGLLIIIIIALLATRPSGGGDSPPKSGAPTAPK